MWTSTLELPPFLVCSENEMTQLTAPTFGWLLRDNTVKLNPCLELVRTDNPNVSSSYFLKVFDGTSVLIRLVSGRGRGCHGTCLGESAHKL